MCGLGNFLSAWRCSYGKGRELLASLDTFKRCLLNIRIFACMTCHLGTELQNSRKVLSGHSGQKDFSPGHVTFRARLLNAQGQASYLLTNSQKELLLFFLKTSLNSHVFQALKEVFLKNCC